MKHTFPSLEMLVNREIANGLQLENPFQLMQFHRIRIDGNPNKTKMDELRKAFNAK